MYGSFSSIALASMRIEPMKSSLFSSARRLISSIAFWISSPMWLNASARKPTSLRLRTLTRVA